MAKEKLRLCDVAYAAFEFVKKHKLDTNEPTHLMSVSKTFQQSPALLVKLLTIQRNVPQGVTARWRAEKNYTVHVVAMYWLASQKFKTPAEFEAAFSALQYSAEVGV